MSKHICPGESCEAWEIEKTRNFLPSTPQERSAFVQGWHVRAERESAQPSSSAIPVIPDAVRDVLSRWIEWCYGMSNFDERRGVVEAFLASSPTVTREQIVEAIMSRGFSPAMDYAAKTRAEAQADAVLALLRGGAQK